MLAHKISSKAFWLWLLVFLFGSILTLNYFLPVNPSENELQLVFSQDIPNATLLPKPKPLSALSSLKDHNNKPFGLEQLKGKWSFLFFGYTSCPDVCPIEMATLKKMVQHISNPPIPQVILVSIDPTNDTPEKLKSYLSKFSEDFIGLTGSATAIAAFAKELGIYHEKSQEAPKNKDANDPHAHHAEHSSANLEINHSATFILINPQAEYHAIFSAPHEAKQLAESVTKITQQHSAQQ